MTNNKMRCHFSIIIEKTAGIFIFCIVLALSDLNGILDILTSPDFQLADLKEMLPFLLGFFGCLLLIFGYHFLVWRKTFIYIDGDTFVVERNTLNRKKSTFSISSIANINLERNAFELLLGTYRLKLDTDSLSTADSTDVSIVLSAQKAHALKKELLTLMKKDDPADLNEISDPAKSDCTAEASVSYASLKEVLTHCFFNLSTGLLFLTLIVIIGVPLLFYLGKLSLGDILPQNDSNFMRRLLTILILVFTYGYSLLKQLFCFYHFSCFRQGDSLIIRYGFLRKQDFTIPIKRINALQIIQPPLARLTGRMEARLICIGLGDSDTEKPQLTLCMKKKDFYKHMKELLPEFSTESLQTVHKLPKGSGAVSLFSCICSLLLIHIGVVTAGFIFEENLFDKLFFIICYSTIIILYILYSLLHYFSMGTWLDKEHLILQDGAYSKQIWLIPYRKIQFVTYKQNFISRRFGILKGHINILASMGNNILFFSFISEEKKQKLNHILLE